MKLRRAINIFCHPNTFALISITLLCTTCTPKVARTNILLITVDTLRADHLGLYGYARPTSPNLDKWFSEGTVFERAYATSSYTPPSILSILTGQLPQRHGVRYFMQIVDEKLDTVPKRLAQQGYQTAGIVSSFVLTRQSSGLDSHFEYYDDSMMERERNGITFERTGKHTTDAAIAWLRAQRDPSRPFFLWIHYMDPHGPYTPPPSFAKRFTHDTPRIISSERIAPFQRQPGLNDGLAYVDLYDGEIAHADDEIGRLIQDLKDTRILDSTLLILTSDHGESMMDHERWFRHGYQVYDELIRVPLLVRGPGFGKKRVSDPVSIADIAPTILQAANVELPSHVYGEPLDDYKSDRIFFSEGGLDPESGRWRSAVRGHEKWMALMPIIGTKPLAQRYYNLQEDPNELNAQPWEGQRAEVANALFDLNMADPEDYFAEHQFRSGTKVDSAIAAPQSAIDAQEKLRALGYLD